MLINSLFYIFSNLILISSLLVICVQNSIYSVLFLVISFVSSACLLFLLECEFLSLMFIVIYVGAIAVLFLFVVMMLDIKNLNFVQTNFKQFPFGVFLGSIFLFEILSLLSYFFKTNPYNNSNMYNFQLNWFEKIDTFTEIESIGQILYTEYVLQFLMAGNILLLATIAASVLIVSTKISSETKPQIIFKQLSRNSRHSLLK